VKRASVSLLIVLLLAVVCCASDVAVVVDVSGSMAHYGPWQLDAIRVISNVLEKGAIGEESVNWSVSGDAGLLTHFRLGSGDHIQLIKFGSIHPDVSSYFPAESLSSTDELKSKFPSLADFHDAHTNKELATAVAVKLVGGPHTPARIMSISDFLSDADLKQEQQEFVNSVMQGTSIENKVVLSWKKNPRVMLRFQYITVPSGSASPENDKGEKGALELIPARLNAASKSVVLSWRPVGVKPLRYDVKAVSPDGTVLLSKAGLIASEVLLPDAPGGEFTWTVSAHYSGGGIVNASRRELFPDNSNIGVLITLALIAVLMVGGFLFLRKHGDTMMASVRKALGRSSGSDL
jgi:hypothetical protein